MPSGRASSSLPAPGLRAPVDRVDPDGGQGADGSLVVELHGGSFSALAEPDVAEMLEHRRQRRRNERRIDAWAEPLRLRLPDLPRDPTASRRASCRVRPLRQGSTTVCVASAWNSEAKAISRSAFVSYELDKEATDLSGLSRDVADLGIEIAIAREHGPGCRADRLVGLAPLALRPFRPVFPLAGARPGDRVLPHAPAGLPRPAAHGRAKRVLRGRPPSSAHAARRLAGP